MKKLLLLVFVLTSYGYIFGQRQLYPINYASEIECVHSYVNRSVQHSNGNRTKIKYTETLEDTFSLLDSLYGEKETQNIINMIESGDIHQYTDKLIKIKSEEAEIKACIINNDLLSRLNNESLSFIKNGKVYVLTYEPYIYGKRKLYLYQRIDHNQWVKASGIVQIDDNQTSITTVSVQYGYEDKLGFSSVDVLQNGIVVMFIANTIKHNKGELKYNNIVLFMPQSDGTYNFITYTPLDYKTRFPNHVIVDDGITVTGNEIKIKTINPNIEQMNCSIIFKPTFNGIECNSNQYQIKQ